MSNVVHVLSGIAMTFCYLVCGIPQIIKTFKTKSAKDLSLGTIALTSAGHSFAIVYGLFGSNNFWTFVCYIGGLTTTTTMCFLWMKYGREKR
jgi:uncharacterized protein with PQ loop repeat